MSDNVVILGAKRTPMGSFQGMYSEVKATQLGSVAIEGAVRQAGVDGANVDEVVMGCVLTAGVGQAPARQAALGAKLPQSVTCSTVNKVCGSGMKAIMTVADQIRVGDVHLAVAGGMENMTRAPYMLDKGRNGHRMGHGAVLDHIFLDGLENAYDSKLMGCFADATADKYGFSREDQDAYAAATAERALQAFEEGWVNPEIEIVTMKDRKGNETNITRDEPPQRVRPEKMASLRPAFGKDGTVTAANASSISDGAAALVLASEKYAKEHDLKPRAMIRGYTSFAHAPEWFTTAPVGAVEKLLKQVGWSVDDVDLFEINEAFAVVTMAAIKDLGLDEDKVNVFGGACALGHPIGASGARIVVTLLNALEQKGLKRGIATLCIGGGEATAMAIERV